jgi:16S rRNA (guanine527-N7)-methyltransferase
VKSQARLLEILIRARSLGLLGPGDPAAHLAHSLGFVEVAEAQLGAPPGRFADLGTGGGVPGLALALAWPDTTAAFIESAVRRCEILAEWVTELDLQDRVQILEGRAETWAQAADIRETFDLVTARSFARPAVTSEIAAGLVAVGGILVVSEPPISPPDRWPVESLRHLGFGSAAPVAAADAHYAALTKTTAAAPGVPRGVGKPAKRPLW